MTAIYKKTVFIFLFVLLSLTINTVFAESINVPDYLMKALFNDKLSKDEQTKLSKGEIVVRNIGNYKKICINDINDNTE